MTSEQAEAAQKHHVRLKEYRMTRQTLLLDLIASSLMDDLNIRGLPNKLEIRWSRSDIDGGPLPTHIELKMEDGSTHLAEGDDWTSLESIVELIESMGPAAEERLSFDLSRWLIGHSGVLNRCASEMDIEVEPLRYDLRLENASIIIDFPRRDGSTRGWVAIEINTDGRSPKVLAADGVIGAEQDPRFTVELRLEDEEP